MQTSEIISSLLDYFTASAAYLRYLVKDNANERNKYQASWTSQVLGQVLIISQRVPLIFAILSKIMQTNENSCKRVRICFDFTANKFYVVLFCLFEVLFGIFTLFVLANRPLFAATKQCKSAPDAV